jgi:hypothetical protein
METGNEGQPNINHKIIDFAKQMWQGLVTQSENNTYDKINIPTMSIEPNPVLLNLLQDNFNWDIFEKQLMEGCVVKWRKYNLAWQIECRYTDVDFVHNIIPKEYHDIIKNNVDVIKLKDNRMACLLQKLASIRDVKTDLYYCGCNHHANPKAVKFGDDKLINEIIFNKEHYGLSTLVGQKKIYSDYCYALRIMWLGNKEDSWCSIQ